MSGIPPVVRNMILCKEARLDPSVPDNITLEGLVNTIRADDDPPFPCRVPLFCVYLRLTGGRGEGRGRVAIRFAETGEPVFLGPGHTISFVANPLLIRILNFRVRNCVFPRPGLYYVQFWYDAELIAEQSLLVR